ncbi:RNA-directed DNA polymerase, eukaryota [Tanacetum coccineum]
MIPAVVHNQKSKVRWGIEGDENTKFFHGILDSKCSQLAIRGTFVDGEWIVDPFAVKSTFPPGCNSSFIALIPKISDAKGVKDYRPISLIGSLFIAFVSNRQTLDGLFIFNELLSWCKHKKYKAMVFKLDFEKEFDSIRWDYLQDNLKMFGFGDKWCGWINCCLNSAMGSVLVNGSPTSGFQFHKGLKQGNPLSPILFILIMESLHFSFSKVTNACLFSSIPIDSSSTLSHLFFADDAIFIEEVKAVATTMSSSIFTTPFVHLGVKVWSLEATSEFFVKSIRQLIDDSILSNEKVTTRWVKVTPIKINVFAWIVRLDKLPVRLNLSLRGIDISTIICPLCHFSVEPGSHIFFSCLMAHHLWRKLMRWRELEDIDLAHYDD